MSSHHFNTPPDLLAQIRKLSPQGFIGLDPCGNESSQVEATTEWWGPGVRNRHHRGNGLVESWRGHGLVFMNPPHSMSPNNIEPWMEKAYVEFCDWTMMTEKCSDPDQFVGLIPAKTDTAWFHQFVTEFPVRCFLKGRPKFWLDGQPMPGPGKFASMLIYAGNQPMKSRTLFAPLGWIV